MTETNQLVTMNVKDGQINFTNLPDGVVVEINNYDTGIPVKATVDPERVASENLLQDNDGAWYHAYTFVNPNTLTIPEEVEPEVQLEMEL